MWVLTPNELISLIHHIELNRSGWWDKAIQQLVIATIWMAGRPLDCQQISKEMQNKFSVNLEIDRIKEQVKSLCSSEVLLCLPSGDFKIAEKCKLDFEKRLTDVELLQKRVKEKFINSLVDNQLNVDYEKIWKLFNECFLFPLVKDMGAKTYELLSGKNVELENLGHFQKFLEHFPPKERTGLGSAVISFLDPQDPDVRAYVFNQLNAFFFLEAGNLDKGHLESLNNIIGSRPVFEVFVDTNFLISILELDEDTANEAAQKLLKLIENLNGKVNVRLKVLPTTIDEIKATLEGYMDYLKDLRLTSGIAQIAAASNVSGVALKFAQKNQVASQAISSKEYFEPYINNTMAMLRVKNIVIHNENTDDYNMKQQVIDDILIRSEFEKKRYKDKAKSYNKLKHDIVLWHYTKDKRPQRVESPLDARYWVATVDFRFLGFDAYKRRTSPKEVPICIHPIQLMQMLQLWTARTPQFEEAVLSNLRPLIFQGFNFETEQLTIQILKTISRFEDIDKLPKEVITSILMNDALRQKMQNEDNLECQIALIRDALVDELKAAKEFGIQLKLEVEEKDKHIEDKEKEIEQKDQVITERDTLINGLLEQIKEKDLSQAELMQHLDLEKEKVNKLQDQFDEFLEHKRLEEKQRKLKDFRRKFLFKWTTFFLGLLGVGIIFSKVILNFYITAWWKTYILILSPLILLWFWLFDKKCTSSNEVSDWTIVIFLHKIRKMLFGLVGTVMGGTITRIIWEMFTKK